MYWRIKKTGRARLQFPGEIPTRATIQTPRRTLNTKIVGKSAVKIAEMAGFSVPPNTRALIAHADGVGPDHPISMEKLSPILAFYVVKDWREGCAKCIEILNFADLATLSCPYKRRTGCSRVWTAQTGIPNMREYARRSWRRRVYDESLPAMTLGCGAAGGNITSDKSRLCI